MRRVLVLLRTSSATYAVPVEDVVEVRPATDLRPLPHPAPGVIGMLTGRSGDAVPVLDVLGGGQDHVLVLRHRDVVLGVHAELVVGLVRVEGEDVTAPPRGQAAPLVSGLLARDDGQCLVLDVAALSRLLTGAPDVT